MSWTLAKFAAQGDSHVESLEGNFEDYEKDKVRRLGPRRRSTRTA